MARGQFRVMDSDIHVVEPHDLWLRHIEPRFKDRAPRFEAIDGSTIEGWQFEGIRHAIPAIGDDNIVISTDWPHDDSAYPRAIETFIALEGVSEESKRKILWDNCARLYNLT